MSHCYNKNGIWHISFYYNGKQCKRSLKTRSKKVAEDIRKKIDYEITAGIFELNKYFSGQQMSLSDFHKWIAERSKTNKSAASTRIDNRAFQKLIEFVGNINANKLDYALFETFKSHCLENNLKKTTINMYIRHLKAAFNLGVDAELFEKNPIAKVKQIKMEQVLPFFLNSDQAAKLLNHAKKRSIYLPILIALQTGARIGEIATLKWENIDFDKRFLKIKGKGSKERTVPIPGLLHEELSKRKKERGYVLTATRDPKQLGKNIRKLADKIELEKVTFHTLRHTYASWLAQSGVNLKVIQEILGHTSITTTMIYTHLVPDSKMVAIKVMNAMTKTE